MIDWSTVTTVLLDMDGTLLDLHFDNVFWLEHLPRRYAEHHGMSVEEAREVIFRRMEAVEGTIDWYCLDHWRRELRVDLVVLKREIGHLIDFRPGAEAFLDAVGSTGRRRVLVTNAHHDALALKLERTMLANYVDEIVCAHDYRMSKEHPDFWDALRREIDFDPAHTMLLDDSLGVLRSARDYGIRQVVGIQQPDTRRPPRPTAEFPLVADFDAVMP